MAMLETVAALAFVYALLSVVASAFKELLEAAVQRRKKDLKGALEDLLSPEGARQLLEHGQIEAVLNAPGADLDKYRNWPSYLEPATFASVAAQMHQLKKLKNCKLTRALDRYAGRAEDLAQHIEQLYVQRMERLGGSFKRNAQWWLLGLGLACAVAMDADTIRLARDLGHDSSRRAMVTALAQDAASLEKLKGDCGQQLGVKDVGQLTPDRLLQCVDSALPGVLGWNPAERDRLQQPSGGEWLLGWVLKLIGYLLTAAAVSMGAPFWFDVLNKVSNLRSTLKPLAGDADRQKAATTEQK